MKVEDLQRSVIQPSGGQGHLPVEKAADILRIDMKNTDDLINRKDSMRPA